MKRLSLALALCLAMCTVASAQAVTISVNQFVEHPSLDQSLNGFKDQLADEGFDVKYNIYNAQANMPTVLQIVNQIMGDRADLILAIATPSAQATVQRVKDTPVLFTAVTDPLEAGLVSSMEQPGGNVSGTTDMSPIASQIALIKEIHPDLTSLGIIYNAGEANSVVQANIIKAVCADMGLNLVEATTVNSAGVYQGAQSLIGKVQAVFLPTDNTVISNMEAVIKICIDNKLPLYAAEADSVRRGCIASLAIDYYQLGRQTGMMAAKILRGEARPGDLPVEALHNTTLVINLGMAAQMGVNLPQSVLDRAEEIVE